MEASEPKRVNPVLNIIGVDSFRLGGLNIIPLQILSSPSKTPLPNEAWDKFHQFPNLRCPRTT